MVRPPIPATSKGYPVKNQCDELGGASKSAINPALNGDLFKHVLLVIYPDLIYVIGWYKYNSHEENLEIRRDLSMFDQMMENRDKALMLDYLNEEQLWTIHNFFNGQN